MARITVIATEEGVETARRALIRLGFESKTNFAQCKLISRYSVSNFFNRHPIQVDTFKRICQELTLNWEEIIKIDEELKNEKNKSSKSQGKIVLETYSRSIIVTDELNQRDIAEIILKGDVNSVENLKTLEIILQQYSGYSIKIRDMKAGSIKLTVEGSPEDIQKLISSIELGNVVEVNGFPVEDIRVLDKWQLVQEIISHPTPQRNLSGIDLSDTDLNRANLSGSNLINADLSCADLSNANLTNADLSNADLSETDFSNSLVTGAKFSHDSPGMTEELKKSLINKGAIVTGLLLDKLVTLREWLENSFKPEWLLPRDLVFTPAFMRSNRNKSKALQPSIVRAKEINLGGDLAHRTLALVVRLTPTDTDEVDLQICLYPTAQSGYTDLPYNIQLIVIDEEGSDIMDAQSERFEESLCLSFSGNFGEKFGIKIVFKQSCITEKFVI
ncbi:MAG: DUF1822 family protein [Microcoleaceae cyanobacterium]